MATPLPPWTPDLRTADPAMLEHFVAETRRLEAAGELTAALEAYEAALSLAPGDAELLCGLARLAGRMDMGGQALALWEQALNADPARLEALDGRGRALADLHRYAEAVEALRPAILAQPHEPRLWNTLGIVLNQQGDSSAALAFFDEAVRLEPGFAAALYNRGEVRFDQGELAQAETDLNAAARHAADPGQTAVIAFARALLALHRGELGLGWDAYAERLSPDHPSAPVFQAPGEAWTLDMPLEGAHLLVVGEQGLGDEVMFASLIPEVQAALGPQGLLSLAVEPRLVALFQRSFPAAAMCAHATERRDGRAHRRAPGVADARPVDAWAPLASLPRRFRRTADAFPRRAYLQPDPARVAHWRAWLGEAGPTVGLSWRSGLLTGRRRRHYPELEAWAPALRTPGVGWVNLQYGATDAEIDALEALGGGALRRPALDLRNDLDELAALSLALELVISVPNATAALAAAAGAPVWFVSSPSAWPQLGTGGYPWYARTRSFSAATFGAWAPVLEEVAAALGTWTASFETPLRGSSE